MKNSLKSKSSLTSKVTEAIKSTLNSTPKEPKYVNADGTIAENRETYIEFRQDIIKSAGFGW